MKAVMDESCKKKHQFDRDPASARCQGWVTHRGSQYGVEIGFDFQVES